MPPSILRAPAQAVTRLLFRPPVRRLPAARTLGTASETEEKAAASTAPPARQKQTDPGSHRDMRRAFYIDAVVDKVMNRSLAHPFLMWTRTRAEWYRLLRTRRGSGLFLDRSPFLHHLRSSIRADDLEYMKRFGADKICLARSFPQHSRIKKELYHYKFLSLAESGRRPADSSSSNAAGETRTDAVSVEETGSSQPV